MSIKKRLVGLMGIKIFLLGMVVSGLTGCGQNGFFHDRSTNYCDARICPPVEIPCGLPAEPFSPEYQIPQL